jgi:hypothetical protein
MYFQKVLKGIPELDETEAQSIIDAGLLSNWWRKAGTITAAETKRYLNEENLMFHLNDYGTPLPAGHPLAILGGTYGEVSPFISTTAGTIERRDTYNHLHDPYLTAMRFATKNFRKKGYIVYAYLMTLGKISIELEQFSEDVRDLHVYQEFLQHQKQGEVVRKIIIPSVQIEKMELYDGKSVLKDLKSGIEPTPVNTISNPTYLPPEDYSNIREVLS